MNLSTKQWPLASTIVFLAAYSLIRFFSYFFPPETILNTVFALGIVVTTGYFLFKKPLIGWLIIVAELTLGGGGAFLSVGFLSLRTTLLIVSLSVYALRYHEDLWQLWKTERSTLLGISLFLASATLAGLHGITNHHPLKLVIADTIPYFFVLYYFPLRSLLQNADFRTWSTRLLTVGITGNILLTLGTFALFSSGLDVLQSPYYHWFRDIAGGKITDLTYHFFRTVLNEHLLTVPLLITLLGTYIFSPHASGSKHSTLPKTTLTLAALLLIILSVNLTRVYYLALGVGLASFCTLRHARRWLLVSICSLTLLASSFIAIHTLASRGKSLGLELFGLRLQSIASPAIEDSSLSRLLLLPNILEKIKKNPLTGNGLGDQVTVYSPVIKQTITTPQFDWGYFELFAEFGLIMLIGWTVLISLLVRNFWLIHSTPNARWLFASFITLSVINITSPAFFHVLGILWLAGLLAETERIKKQLISELPLK